MTPCPVASRIFHDWSEALREASSPEHRDSEELLTSYAGAVGKELDRHLAACVFCKETPMDKPVTVALLIVAVIALVIGLAIGVSLPNPSHPLVAPFTDTQGHWAESYIETIRLAGLTAGCNTDPPMYCPDRPLTRAEAAVFLARILDQ